MTAPSREITLATIPGMRSMLARAAMARKPVQDSPECKPLLVRADAATTDTARLAKFNAVCSFAGGDQLPLTFPHVMAFPLHMQLMLEPEFPFSPMGAVHVRNRIRQHRAIAASEALDFSARLDGMERVEKGYEVSIVTEVAVNGEVVWDDLSVMLIRSGGGGAGKKGAGTPARSYPESVQWALSGSLGRQYAAASGDFNPIHLYPFTAKLLGFRRQIVHGMWSKSRCIAHLLPADHAGPAAVDVAFKLPIFLPATVTLMYEQGGTGSQFELRDAAGEKPHLAGELTMKL